MKHLTIVIKLGSSSIIDEKTHDPIIEILATIVATVVQLRQDGHRVVLVSSGAIAVGLQRLDIAKRPKQLSKRQALAAVGQCRLMALWDKLFELKRQPVAQILLTRNDIADRTQYLNAQNTFSELLSMGVIPIVNENDTLAVSEIKFGDNDTLSAITAAMVQADYLFLMTDVDCLFDKNPRVHADAKAIEEVADISKLAADVSSAGSALGTGGMGTKIVAARLATSAGVMTVITHSARPGNVARIVAELEERKHAAEMTAAGASFSSEKKLDESVLSETMPSPAPNGCPLHTRFLPSPHPIRDRSFWLLHGLAPRGKVFVDAGAHQALINKAGLLPVGVVDVQGSFAQHEAVQLFVSRSPSASANNNNNNNNNTDASLIDPGTDASAETSVPVSGEGIGRPPSPLEIGRALVNFSSTEIARIKGLHSMKIEGVLGYADSEYVAQRENVRLFKQGTELGSGPGTPMRSEMVMRGSKGKNAGEDGEDG